MTPTAQTACKPILDNLDQKVRQGVNQRVDAMIRELDYLGKSEDRALALIRSVGWSDDHLHVIFLLNSVYQRVLGPQKSAAREGPQGLGSTIPIHHGSTVFDRQSAKKVNAADLNFNAMNRKLCVNVYWLYANTCRDLVYLMAGIAGTPGINNIEGQVDE